MRGKFSRALSGNAQLPAFGGGRSIASQGIARRWWALVSPDEGGTVMTRCQVGGMFARRVGAWRVAAAIYLLVAALLAALPASAAPPAPIKLAIFDFELEDMSAAASSPGETSSDAEQLARATDGVRRLVAGAGRYQLVDVGAAEAAAATTHTLRDCGGCEAAVALKLGADQSLLGVVRRISRMEYLVRFQIRNARTGAIVSDADSGLRMGANDSWDRGAARLIKDRLLESPAQR